MKVYIGDKKLIEQIDPREAFDFVKVFLENKIKGDWYDRNLGVVKDVYTLAEDVNKADFCILPYSWNYYVNNNLLDDAVTFIEKCKNAGKEVITVNLGDFGVKIPYDDVIVLRQNGYESKRLQKQFAMSVFISDPVKAFFNGEMIYRKKQQKPVVGFCGQGKMPWYKYGAMALITVQRNMKYYIGLSRDEPHVIYPSTLRRNNVLSVLSRSENIADDFIIREKYRAGAKTEEEERKTTLEFYDNIRDTDYTLAIRGGGNFSVRIYETLANGRIPLYVNTDSILPFDKQIDWKKHVVWVEESDIKFVGELLADFHNEIHPDDFIQMQMNNRKLWEEYLSFEGFYRHLIDLVRYSSSLNR